MSDNTDQRAPQDAKRINMKQDYEVRYWAHRFNVTRDQLQRAVNEVGPMADAVEQQLMRK
jgi:hypothetical protein